MPELGKATFHVEIETRKSKKELADLEREANRSCAEIGKSIGVAEGQMELFGETSEETGKKVKGQGQESRKAADETDKHASSLRGANAEAAKTSTTFERLTGRLRRNTDETARASKETKGLTDRLFKFNVVTTATGRVLKLLKIPAIVSAITALIGVVSALTVGAIALGSALGPVAAGLVALTSSLGPAIGGMASLTQGMLAAKQATSVWKLAMTGAGDGMKDFKKQFEYATPAMNSFHRKISGFLPQLIHLRNLAQGPILRGLSQGMDAAKGNIGRLNPVVRETANQIGALAKQAGQLVGTKGFGDDFVRLGRTNVKLIGNFGRGAINLANALRHVLIPAQGLTRWLGRSIEGWTANLSATAKANRENGKSAAFFDRTRHVLSQLWKVITNVGGALMGLGRASRNFGGDLLQGLVNVTGRWKEWNNSIEGQNTLKKWFADARAPLKDLGATIGNLFGILMEVGRAAKGFRGDMLGSIRDTTERWHEWTESMRGQNAMKKWFETAREPLRELGRLMGAIGTAFTKMGDQPALTGLIRQLRVELLPAIMELFEAGSGGNFLSALITALSQLASAAAPFVGSGGVLTMLVSGLGGFAAAVGWVAREIPGAAQALSILGTSMAVLSAIGMTRFISKAFGMRAGLNVVKAAAAATSRFLLGPWGVAVAKSAAMMVVHRAKTMAIAAATKAWTAAQWLLNIAMRANPIGLIITGIALLVGAFVLAWKNSDKFRKIATGAFNAVLNAGRAAWDWLKKNWPLVLGILTGPIGLAVVAIVKNWDKIKSTARSVFNWLKGAASDVGSAVKKFFVSGFEGAINTVIGLVNNFIGLLNKLPFVDISPLGRVGGGGGGRSRGGPNGDGTTRGLARGGSFGGYAQGGKVTKPTIIMGEEAPLHPEWVIPENPAYRDRAIKLWAMAGQRIGAFARGGNTQEFAKGGVAGALSGALSSAKDFISKPILGAIRAAAGGLASKLPAGFGGLANFLAKGAISHSAKKSKEAGPRGGIPTGDAAPNLRAAISKAREMGLALTSFLRPNDTGSLHSQGRAADVAGPAGKMAAFYRWAKGHYKYIEELFYDPLGGIDKNRQIGAIGGHTDHVHIAFAQGGVIGNFRKAIAKTKAGPKAQLALWMAGIVESGLKNLNYGDRDSKGALQLRTGLHGEDLAMDPYRSAVAFLTRGFTGKGGAISLARSNKGATAGQIAQMVQGSAFPSRYDQVRDRALKYVRKARDAAGGGGGGGRSREEVDPRLNFRVGPGGEIFGRGNKKSTASQGTMGRHGGKMAPGGNTARPGTPLGNAVDELTMARTGLTLARADKAAPVTVGAAVPAAQGAALRDQERVAKGQYKAAMKEVRRLEAKQKKAGLGPKGREKLKAAYDAATSAMGALNSVREAITAVNEEWDPLAKQLQAFEVAGSRASLTDTIWDDIGALVGQEAIAIQRYANAVKSGDPAKIGEAASNLKSIRDAVRDATPTRGDWLDLMTTQAQETLGIADDLAVLGMVEADAAAKLTASYATGDPRQVNQALQNLQSVRQSIRDLTPTVRDWADFALQQAQETMGYEDDLAALRTIEADATRSYQEALQTGDPRRMREALSNLQGVRQQIQDLVPTEMDYADLALTRAELTESLEDDIAAWSNIVAIRQRELIEAEALGDPRRIAEALRNLKSAREGMEQIEGLPSVLKFTDALPAGFLAEVAATFGKRGEVNVTQIYTNPPKDQFSNMKQAQFAAQAVFTGG